MGEKKRTKPAREMTTEDVGEWLFGPEGKRKVDRELEDGQPAENAEESEDDSSIPGEDT